MSKSENQDDGSEASGKLPQVFLKEACDKVLLVMRYAITSSNGVYHLVIQSEDKTLCGLDVAPIIINRPTSSSTLYLTEIIESDRRVCENCADFRTKAENSSL